MEVRHTKDIVTFKNLIGLKVDDEELEIMVKDAKLILSHLGPGNDELGETSPTLQFLQALTELNPEPEACSYKTGVCACDFGPTCQARQDKVN